MRGESPRKVVQIRRTRYHGQDGYLVCEWGSHGARIFTPSRAQAELLREAVRSGEAGAVWRILLNREGLDAAS